MYHITVFVVVKNSVTENLIWPSEIKFDSIVHKCRMAHACAPDDTNFLEKKIHCNNSLSPRRVYGLHKIHIWAMSHFHEKATILFGGQMRVLHSQTICSIFVSISHVAFYLRSRNWIVQFNLSQTLCMYQMAMEINVGCLRGHLLQDMSIQAHNIIFNKQTNTRGAYRFYVCQRLSGFWDSFSCVVLVGKVASQNPDGVTGFWHRHVPNGNQKMD